MARQGSRCQPKNRRAPAGSICVSARNSGLLTLQFLTLCFALIANPTAVRDVSADDATVVPSQQQASVERASIERASIERGDRIDSWFRVQWSTEEPREWHIRLKIVSDESSEFVEFENHCTSDSSTGAFTFVSGQPEFSIDTREPSNGGAVRVHVRASQSAQLSCELISAGEAPRTEQVAIADLMPANSTLERSAPATATSPAVNWTFQRTLDDAVQVILREPSTVISVGEPLQFSLAINRLEAYRSSNVTLRYSLRRVNSGTTVASQTWDLALNEFGSASKIDVTASELSEPGVYELRSVIETSDDGIWSKFRRRKELVAESGLTLVVVDPQNTAAASSAEMVDWREIQTIRPSDSRQWSWTGFVPATTEVVLSTIHLQDDTKLATSNYAGQTVSTLEPNASYETKLPVDRTGAPHLISIRYPSGARARFRIDVLSSSQPLQPRKTFAIKENAVGIDHSPWATHSFVYYPGGYNETIRLTNLDAKGSVAFHSIQVSAGPQTLAGPIVDSVADSVVGSSNASVVAFSLKDFGWVDQLTTDFDSRSDMGAWLPETKSLYRLHIAASRLADYVRALGMNAVVIPANQGGRAWFATNQFSRRYVRAGESSEQLAAVLHALDASGLGVIVSLDPTMLLTQVEADLRVTDADASTPLRSRRSGVEAGRYQPLDERVQSSTDLMLADLMRVCDGHACFTGVSLNCSTNSHLSPLASDEYLGLSILQRFVNSQPEFGHSLASPDSTRQFELWRRGDGRATFEAWLLSEQRRYLEGLAEHVGRFVLLRLPVSQVNFAGDTGFCTQSWPKASSNLYPVVEHRRASLGSLSTDCATSNRLSCIAAMEPNHLRPLAIGVSEVDGAEALPSAVFQESLALDLARMIDRVHPKVVIVDCNVLTGSVSPPLASALRSIALSPMTQLNRVVSSDANANPVSLYQHPMSGVLLAINLAPWATEIDINSGTDQTWTHDAFTSPVLNAATNADVQVQKNASANAKSIRLTAGEIALIRANTDQPVRIVDWSSRPADGEAGLIRVKDAVTRVVERLGVFSEMPDYSVLANGGFEQPSDVGIVGWLAAQHPPGAVRVDTESIEGKQSVCLTSDSRTGSRTWIVSETIPVPASGRLAVSLACRGELQPGSPPANQEAVGERAVRKLRITIEGTRNGEPVRFASETEVPADGRWQARRVFLELDGIEPSNTESLRLAIDSLSDGRIWIDDVHLHDWFPLESERNDLQGQSFLAVQGLQRGNIVPAARLMRNDWARYLLTTRVALPPAESQQAGEVSPPPVRDAGDKPSTTPSVISQPEVPGMAERLRSWLPRRLRF